MLQCVHAVVTGGDSSVSHLQWLPTDDAPARKEVLV
jgi:hypothetical protein